MGYFERAVIRISVVQTLRDKLDLCLSRKLVVVDIKMNRKGVWGHAHSMQYCEESKQCYILFSEKQRLQVCMLQLIYPKWHL